LQQQEYGRDQNTEMIFFCNQHFNHAPSYVPNTHLSVKPSKSSIWSSMVLSKSKYMP